MSTQIVKAVIVPAGKIVGRAAVEGFLRGAGAAVALAAGAAVAGAAVGLLQKDAEEEVSENLDGSPRTTKRRKPRKATSAQEAA